jgi:hypothetical protein
MCKQFRRLVVERGRNHVELLCEAFNDLFIKPYR